MFKEMFERQIYQKLMFEHDIYVLSGTATDYHFKYDGISCIDWYIDNAKMYIDGTFITGRVYGFISDHCIKVVGFNAMQNGVVYDRLTFKAD